MDDELTGGKDRRRDYRGKEWKNGEIVRKGQEERG